LVNLAQDDYLPANFIVVGVARRPLTHEAFRANLWDGVKKYSRRPISEEVWARFSQNVFYQSLDATAPGDFTKLRTFLEEIGNERGVTLNYLYYLATAPSFFAPISSNLREAGLVADPRGGNRSTVLVVEKPFGHDLASAKDLNHQIRQSFAEEQIYRIDHYLGKETVQNILVFRFANGMFEPLWNSRYVDHIEISVCEDIGVVNRGEYFDNNGITRDIVQNHVLQMLSLLCIEPPISLSDADSIRDEKVKVLRMIRRMTPDEVHANTVRAHYGAGYIQGREVVGYLQEDGVRENSSTETFVAMKLEIDNWRWSGVPIYVRVGKRLPKRITEISVFFKGAPLALFKGRQIDVLQQNVLSIQVQPKEGISLSVNSKPPGPRMRVRAVEMDFTYDHSFGIASPEAYERLLLDAMKGDATLFTRNDEIEEAWDLLAPIFSEWQSASPPELHTYEAGTWGPAVAAELLRRRNHSWRRL
jgi:glucose-6-phosphate 1-dehydrogenase